MTHATPARPRAAPAPSSRRIGRGLVQLPVAALAFGAIMLGSADGALRTLTGDAVAAKAIAEMTAPPQPPPVIWAVDKDGDGVTDYYNPVHGAMRGYDDFGSGAFGASRDGGKRKHEGVDYVVAPGGSVRSPISGEVARIGYAYRGVGGYRIVEIVNSETKVKARVFYVAPNVNVGDEVRAGQEIGAAQDLARRYPGITNHVHVELRDRRQQLIDASEELPAPRTTYAAHAIGARGGT